jgi:peptide/nickel transport system ATP-binding protein
MEPLLRVRDLHVHYTGEFNKSRVLALRGVDLEIAHGQAVGILGESGCGKSTLALAIVGLLPVGGMVTRGSVRLRGRDLVGSPESELRSIRGAEIEIIYQDAALVLHPVLRVGGQVSDVLRAHYPWDRIRCQREARDILRKVGLAGTRIGQAYPHQLSGGQRQRVVTAQALACTPKLVIADEPTTSLDSTTQAEILELLGQMRQELGVALLLISHDPGVLAELCDHVLVMYAGRIVEEGRLAEVYRAPLHPYTRGLLQSRVGPTGVNRRRGSFPCIPGSPPDPAALPPGCSFEPRCAERMAVCAVRKPPQTEPEATRRVQCFKYGS